jgi:hypothetical protein
MTSSLIAASTGDSSAVAGDREIRAGRLDYFFSRRDTLILQILAGL